MVNIEQKVCRLYCFKVETSGVKAAKMCYHKNISPPHYTVRVNTLNRHQL